MNKKYIIRTVIILLIAIPFFIGPFGIFGAFFYSREDVAALATNLNIPAICILVPPSDTCDEGPCAKTELCYKAVGTNNKNPKACDLISKGDETLADVRQDCYISSGISLHDAAIRTCPTLKNFAFSENIDNLFGVNDAKLGKQARCYGFFAVKMNDSSLCAQINNEVIRNQCFLEFVPRANKPDVNICETQVSDNAKDGCYSNMAQNKTVLDIELCNKIHDQSRANFCRKEILRVTKKIPAPTPLPNIFLQ